MTPIIRLTRATVINVLSRPFIEMAVIKGLDKWRIFIHHALPQAVINASHYKLMNPGGAFIKLILHPRIFF